MSVVNVAIIGGGVSGLACAYKLSRSRVKVNLFESEPFLGGLASWYHHDGLNIPKTYHHVLHSDATLMQMIRELKLKVEWKKIRTGFYKEGNVYPFNGSIDLLRFKPLPLIDRFKLGLLILSTWRAKSLENLEGISVENWIKDKVGVKAFENFIDPLASSYFGSAEDISAAYLANRWKTESKSITGLLGFLDIAEIVNGLEKEVLDHGGSIRINAPVTSISVEDCGFKLKIKDEIYHSDYLVSTIPAPQLLKIVESKGDLERELGGVTYRGCICVTYWLKEKVSDYYWINILEKTFPFIACFEHANLNPYVKGGVVYAVTYLDEKSDLWGKSGEDIANYFSEHLAKIFSKFKNPIHYEVFRTHWSTPVYKVGFKNPPLKTSIDRLYVAGISRIFPRIRSMGPPMQTGLDVAEEILKEMGK